MLKGWSNVSSGMNKVHILNKCRRSVGVSTDGCLAFESVTQEFKQTTSQAPEYHACEHLFTFTFSSQSRSYICTHSKFTRRTHLKVTSPQENP